MCVAGKRRGPEEPREGSRTPTVWVSKEGAYSIRGCRQTRVIQEGRTFQKDKCPKVERAWLARYRVLRSDTEKLIFGL